MIDQMELFPLDTIGPTAALDTVPKAPVDQRAQLLQYSTVRGREASEAVARSLSFYSKLQ